VLIVALWVMLFLGVLAMALAWRVSDQLAFASWLRARTEAYYAARAGVESALDFYADTNKWKSVLLLDADSAGLFRNAGAGDASFSVFTIRESEATVSTNFGLGDEDSKISLNWATNEAGYAAVRALIEIAGGVEQAKAGEIAQCILDWIDPDDSRSEHGAENGYYTALRSGGYRCANAPFSCPEELLLVKGIDTNLFMQIRQYMTVHRDNGAININSAGATVLRALASIRKGAVTTAGEELVARIMKFREDGGVFEDPDKRAIRRMLFADGDLKGLEAEEWAILEWVINQNLISVQSRYLYGISEGVASHGDHACRRIEFVYDRKAGNIRFWHEY